ncbi:MAG: hypothetical protein K6B52_05900 [Clostridiales bacterium]|nr:hypothetical protein [Clostridiales bacterium]
MTEEEKLFIAKFDDKALQCSEGFMITSTFFVDTHLKTLVFTRALPVKVRCIFYSPVPDSERNIAVFLPEYISASTPQELKEYFLSEPDDDPTAVIRIDKDRFSKPLTHRDYLGALMSLGIKREILGDIAVNDSGCYVACLKKNARYIAENLSRAGRGTLKCEVIDSRAVDTLEKKKPEFFDFTVSSPRLDSIIKNGFNLSRTQSVDMITHGLVFVNGLECLKPDKKINPGDKITLRHRGRFVVKDCSRLTKKGRIVVEAVR